MISLRNTLAAAAAAVLLAATGQAHAGVYSVTVSEGLSNGTGFNTLAGNPYAGANTASATFTYTGALSFSDLQPQNSNGSGDLNTTFGFSNTNISGYAGTGSVVSNSATVANFSTLSTFLASSGSAATYQYGSYYTFDLGVLAAGTVLTISHDDGIAVFQGATQVGTSSTGPTTQVTDVVTVGTSADTILRYSRQNGSPSVLTVSVPEPASLALLGAGLFGLGLVRRKRGNNAA